MAGAWIFNQKIQFFMHIVVRFLDTLSTFMTLFILKLMLEVSQIWSMNFAYEIC